MLNLFKKQVYVGLLEIFKDRDYYYHSNVGPEYCHLTEKGVEALIDYMNIMAPSMLKKDNKELEDLAKKLTWNELKK